MTTSASLTRREGLRALTLLGSGALGAVALSACGAGGGSASGGKDIVFAAVPAEASQSLEQTFSAIVSLIEKVTGRSVVFQNASDYAAVIEGQRAGKVDIASYGPFSYVIAKGGGVPIEAVAAPVDEEGAVPAYTSLCYTTPASGITTLAGLRGKKVAFVDKASTSGYLVPMKGLLDVGISLETDLEPVFAGGHDASLLALASGQVDAAFAHDAMLTTLTASGQIPEGALVQIWESDPIPEDPIALNTSTLDADTVAAIRTAIQTKANKPALVSEGICTSEEDCVLPEEIKWGYVPVTDSDYDVIRDICSTTKADACTSVS